MTKTTTKPDSSQPACETTVDLFDNWFDPIETGVRARAREFIDTASREAAMAAFKAEYEPIRSVLSISY